MTMPVQDPKLIGFTLHTPGSITMPGRWGVLPLMYAPAAYAAARESLPAQGD